MAEFHITGKTALTGEIPVRGAKNSALKAIASIPLFSGPLRIKNLPAIEDVMRMTDLLKDIGAKVEMKGERELLIDPSNLKGKELNKEIAQRLRASIVATGPLLARQKKISSPYPGGCVIGKRPIDLFIEGFRALGAKVQVSESGFEARAEKLTGAHFTFKKVSVTGTETLMMAAALAHGKTVLLNSAMEPEIPYLAEFLNTAGAHIKGAGTPSIEIMGTGGKLLHSRSSFVTIPDRVEAGSFLAIGALLGSGLTITHCNPAHLEVPLAMLQNAGVAIERGSDWMRVSRPKKIIAFDLQTREYPGFPTDLQAPFVVLLTQALGQSIVFEAVFDGRLSYIDDLNRMGAHIIPSDPRRITISGPTHLRGRQIDSPDLRAGLAFVIAALVAKGESVVRNIYQIDRGYERIEERLSAVGMKIKRVG